MTQARTLKLTDGTIVLEFYGDRTCPDGYDSVDNLDDCTEFSKKIDKSQVEGLKVTRWDNMVKCEGETPVCKKTNIHG